MKRDQNEVPQAGVYITYGLEDGHYAAHVLTVHGTPDCNKRFSDHPPIRTPWYVDLDLAPVGVEVTAKASQTAVALNVYTDEGRLNLKLTKKQLKHLIDVASAILE
jgi:hypothetical protein